MIIDVIGEFEDVSGWHINTTEELEEISQFLVLPTQMRRMFFGVQTYCYKFKDEDEAYHHLGDRIKNKIQVGE